MSVINMAVAKATGRNLRTPEPLTNEQTAELMIETVNICRQLRDEAKEHRLATEKNLLDFAAQMKGWLEVQNRHKKWTLEQVDGVFQREEGLLKKRAEEVYQLLEALTLKCEEADAKGETISREERNRIAEIVGGDIPRN